MSEISVQQATGFVGAYRLEHEIGRGGMGVVFLARHIPTDRKVALKLLAPHYVHDPQFVQRFYREATISQSLQHPNIVQVVEVGQDGDRHFMAMEFVAGETLSELLSRENRLPHERVLEIALATAEALDYAHSRGVVHRDIKPGNLMVEHENGKVVLTDFGIARAGDESQVTLTGTGIGTPTYMAPEQVRGETADGRSDLYALGVLMFRLLAGVPPFQSESPLALLNMHLNDAPPPLRAFLPDVPEWLEAVIERTLRKLPQERYQSGAELAADLRLGAEGRLEISQLRQSPLPAAPLAQPPGSRPAPAAPHHEGGVVVTLRIPPWRKTRLYGLLQRLRTHRQVHGLVGSPERRGVVFTGAAIIVVLALAGFAFTEFRSVADARGRAQEMATEASQEGPEASAPTDVAAPSVPASSVPTAASPSVPQVDTTAGGPPAASPSSPPPAGTEAALTLPTKVFAKISNSGVTGAQIMVEGHAEGQPLPGREATLQLNPGTYSLRFSAPGYQTEWRAVTAEGQEKVVEVQLRPEGVVSASTPRTQQKAAAPARPSGVSAPTLPQESYPTARVRPSGGVPGDGPADYQEFEAIECSALTSLVPEGSQFQWDADGFTLRTPDGVHFQAYGFQAAPSHQESLLRSLLGGALARMDESFGGGPVGGRWVTIQGNGFPYEVHGSGSQRYGAGGFLDGNWVYVFTFIIPDERYEQNLAWLESQIRCRY